MSETATEPCQQEQVEATHPEQVRHQQDSNSERNPAATGTNTEVTNEVETQNGTIEEHPIVKIEEGINVEEHIEVQEDYVTSAHEDLDVGPVDPEAAATAAAALIEDPLQHHEHQPSLHLHDHNHAEADEEATATAAAAAVAAAAAAAADIDPAETEASALFAEAAAAAVEAAAGDVNVDVDVTAVANAAVLAVEEATKAAAAAAIAVDGTLKQEHDEATEAATAAADAAAKKNEQRRKRYREKSVEAETKDAGSVSTGSSSKLSKVNHEDQLAARRRKDRQRYANMTPEQRQLYNAKRREQYHRQTEISRQKRRERERNRYHSLTEDSAKERNARRAKLERERYQRLTPDELEAKNRRRRERAATSRSRDSQSGSVSSRSHGSRVRTNSPVSQAQSFTSNDHLHAPPGGGAIENMALVHSAEPKNVTAVDVAATQVSQEIAVNESVPAAQAPGPGAPPKAEDGDPNNDVAT